MLAIVIAIFGAAAFAHTAPFPFLLEAFRPSKSLWHVDRRPGAPPTVYLTFDDGPNPHWTAPLLDALREHGVSATFFLIDHHITPETAPIVKRIADEGHAIDGRVAGHGRRYSARRCGANYGDYRPRTLPPVSAACRVAQRDDVRRGGSCRVPPCRLELGDVGLGLVAETPG